MVKFSELNGEKKSTDRIRGKNRGQSPEKPQLSFRKLAAEQEKYTVDKGVSEKIVAGKDQLKGSGKALYQKASTYLHQVFEAVRQRKMFPLDPGFEIVRDIVEGHSFQDTLFIEALHFDDPLEFIINNNVNVAIYAVKMAVNLGWSKERQIEIGMAGLLHDIGMALIPEKLIFKQQRLSEAEFKIFKDRSIYSYKILKSFGDDYGYLAECAIQVNERMDGSGYPQGLKENEIHEYAQIIGLVDMYEALVHSRPQREKFHHLTAVKEIIKSGKNLFQRRHLKALLNIFSIFPLRSYVRLNSAAIGQVIETYPDQPLRPKIRIIYDSQQKRVLTERIVNLPDDSLLYIVDSVFEEELQKLSEGSDKSDKEIGLQSAHLKSDDSNAVKKASVTNDNHLAKKKKATVRQAEQPPKTSWLKLGLIAIAIALIVAGIILQAGKRDSKKVISDNLKTSVVKKMPKSRPEEFPEAITKSASSKNVVQAKPSDSGSSGLEGTKIDSDETIKDIGQQSSPRTETAISLEAIPDHEQKVVPYVLDSETKISQLSEKSGADAKSIKLFYPYSVKLVSVRTHAEAEKYLALYRQKGLSAYWVKVDLGAQGIWYRIFAGYFGDIGQAQAIIKTHKLDEAVVKQTKFAVLVGTYASEADVNAQIRMLTKQGFSAYAIKDPNGAFSLYVGVFYTQKGAEDQHAELLSKGIQSKIVER